MLRARMRILTGAFLCAVAGGLYATPAGALPDGRAYEMVSPPSKNGGDVLSDSQRVRAAANGSAVAFASLSGFADVHGGGVSTDYLSERSGSTAPGTSGWSTHGITPKQEPVTVLAAFASFEPLYADDFSPDLDRGIFRAWSPVTDAPNVKKVANLYTRSDLRTPGSGSYELASGCPVCDATSTPLVFPPFLLALWFPAPAGASADFSHVVFESALNLTADAQGFQTKVYESDHGTVRLVDVLPDGSAAPDAIAGQGAGGSGSPPFFTPHVISADGSRIFFTVPISDRGGDLYMRTNHASTVQLNASERTDCADHNPCNGAPEPDPNGARPAYYWDASADGSRVFLSTTEALTNDATANTAGKVYIYDTTKPGSDPNNLRLVSVDHEPADAAGVDPSTNTGVIGASDDGRYLYFTSADQLVAGKPTGNYGIFVWHDDGSASGTEAYIGAETNAPDDRQETLLNNDFTFRQQQARVTPDGRHLLFASHDGVGLLSNNGPTDHDYDHGTCSGVNHFNGLCRELYVYSADTGMVQCASCKASGLPGDNDATDIVRQDNGAAQTTGHLNRAISDNGQRVFFSTTDALVPSDKNGKQDVYEYDAPSATVHLMSTGTDSADSYFMDASASGDDVFFITRQQLVGWDNDGSYDLYDARVGGGFPDPSTQRACVGDPCHGPALPTEAVGASGSATVVGPGNVANPKKKPKVVHCRKGFVRKRVRGKVRCVKKPKPHRKHTTSRRKIRR